MEQIHLISISVNELQDLIRTTVQEVVQVELRDHAKLNLQMITVGEVMKILNCTRPTLKKRERDGSLVPFRNGNSIRYKLEDVEAFLNRTKGNQLQNRGSC